MEKEINIQDIIVSLKKSWKLIIISTLASLLIGSIMTFFVIQPKYESTVKVFIGKTGGEEVVYDQSDLSMYQKLIKTYGEVIKTKDLAKRVIKEKNLDITPQALVSGLTVNPVLDTQIIQIKYTSNSSYDAANVLDGVKVEFISLATELVPNANIKILEDVREKVNPISPNTTMNLAISILLGLMVGVGLAFLREFLDNTYKTGEALEQDLGLSVIGVIPNND